MVCPKENVTLWEVHGVAIEKVTLWEVHGVPIEKVTLWEVHGVPIEKVTLWEVHRCAYRVFARTYNRAEPSAPPSQQADHRVIT